MGRLRAGLIPAGEVVGEMQLVDPHVSEDGAYAAIHAVFGSHDASLHPPPKPAEPATPNKPGKPEITLHARTGVMLTDKGRERARTQSIPLR
ncbi:MAG TPA: hypothetical protein VH143_04720 [Kofleriaceae bacterium]|jgi:hypothetical protein|nr:hypothetical protein [Kofleriaceae bacterium]